MAVVFDGTIKRINERVEDLEGEVFGPDGSAYRIGQRLSGATGTTVKDALVTATGSSTARSLGERAGDIVNASDFGASATADAATNTAAFQAALDTGKHVTARSGATYTINNSLYMKTNGQEFGGTFAITMDASLGKPCLWIGATDAAGTATSVPIVNTKVRGVRFLGSGGAGGTKTIGSAGIAFKKATTTTLDSVFAWYFYAGIDVRGTSLINAVINPDLRYNVIGLYDRTDPTISGYDGLGRPIGTYDFETSRIFGGRIEANANEGVVLGAANVGFHGCCIEGNGATANGGDGTACEVRITPGYKRGTVVFTDCYFETLAANTSTAIIRVDAGSAKTIEIHGGEYFAFDASSRFIIDSASTETVQTYCFFGGTYYQFKNYLRAALTNNSGAVIIPTWADASRDVSADTTATVGATLYQIDRTLGLSSTLPFIRMGSTYSYIGNMEITGLFRMTNSLTPPTPGTSGGHEGTIYRVAGGTSGNKTRLAICVSDGAGNLSWEYLTPAP